MESLIQTVAPQIERQSNATNPFSSSDVYFKVSPRFFTVLPLLPAVSRDIVKYICLNITSEGEFAFKDGNPSARVNHKVFLSVQSLLVHSKVKSEELIRAGIDALIENEVLALHEGDCYWVNFIEPSA